MAKSNLLSKITVACQVSEKAVNLFKDIIKIQYSIEKIYSSGKEIPTDIKGKAAQLKAIFLENITHDKIENMMTGCNKRKKTLTLLSYFKKTPEEEKLKQEKNCT